MIERFTLSKKCNLIELLEFVESINDSDFYYTKENVRYYITNEFILKNFVKASGCVFVKKERGNYCGVVLVWKSVGGGISRYYVKLLADDVKSAKDLLTILLWNCSRELFVKIRKDSKLFYAFKEKGFRFCGARGIQILLNRKFIPITKTFYKKEDDVKEIRKLATLPT